jgi:hypothetical protein
MSADTRREPTARREASTSIASLGSPTMRPWWVITRISAGGTATEAPPRHRGRLCGRSHAHQLLRRADGDHYVPWRRFASAGHGWPSSPASAGFACGLRLRLGWHVVPGRWADTPRLASFAITSAGGGTQSTHREANNLTTNEPRETKRSSRSRRRERDPPYRLADLASAGRTASRRRGRDSNPRSALTDSGFQDQRIRPLCHPSGTTDPRCCPVGRSTTRRSWQRAWCPADSHPARPSPARSGTLRARFYDPRLD